MIKKLLALILLLPSIAFAAPIQIDFLIAGLKDASGNNLSGGFIHTYVVGTTTNKDTWQDPLKASTHANPIELDANGKAQVYAEGKYKIVITNAAGTVLYTHDKLTFGEFNGRSIWGETGGTENAFTVTSEAGATATAQDGDIVNFYAANTNTSATVTANVNSGGAITVRRFDDVALQPGDIKALGTYSMIYNGAVNRWHLLNPSWGITAWSPTGTPQAGAISVPSITTGSGYTVVGKQVFFTLEYSFTLGSSNANYIEFPVPFGIATNVRQPLAGLAFYDGSTLASCFAYILTGTTIRVQPSSAFTVGAGRTLMVSGSYYTT